MAEAPITRTQIIVVGDVTRNSFGDLIFTDKEGVSYPKILAKRVSYFEKVIISGMAVQLNYAVAYGREYIYSATLVRDELSEEVETPSPLAKEAIKLGAEIIPDTKDTKIRSMAVAYSKDLVAAKIIELKDLTKYADKFVDYILSIKRKEDKNLNARW